MKENAIETARLLLVSRDSVVLRLVWSMHESSYWGVESAANAWEAMDRLQSGMTPDLLLLDLPPGDTDGLHILRWLRRLRPGLSIILIGHPDDVEKKQEAVRLGARDYLVRPIGDRQLEMVIRHHLSPANGAIETDITSGDVEFIGDNTFFLGICPIMRELRAQAAVLAKSTLPVLILGEGGSGKETTARLIHKLSVRSGFEFAKVNCAALPSDLLERELFGYGISGATASARAKSGRLELCIKGTVLLDEITEMPLEMQANLMQVVQNKRFIKPGSATSVAVDVRIFASSTTNMEHAISESRLREDLYRQLSASTIHVPSLRERKEELLPLSRHFMHQLARHYGLSPREFSPAIFEACQAYSWPGNLSELENFVKRYLMVGDRKPVFEKNPSRAYEAIENTDLAAPRNLHPSAPSLVQPRGIQPRGNAPGFDSLRALVQNVRLEAERNAIAAALEKTGWNRKAAARLLKVSYRTLLYKIEQYRMRSLDSSLLPGGTELRSKGTGLRSNGGTD